MANDDASAAMIRMAGITKDLGYRKVLRGIDCELPAGELIGLVGTNGAGKSTLLKVMATVLRPNSGEGYIHGHSITAARDAVRAVIGYLGHGTGLYDGMTVKENLWLAGKLRGVSGIGDRVDEVLDRAGVTDYRDTLVRHLSKGLGRRVALERSLFHSPKVLLLDEPFDGLDPPSQEKLESRLIELRDRGVTVVLVTHDLDLGRRICDRGLVLEGGRVGRQVKGSDMARELIAVGPTAG